MSDDQTTAQEAEREEPEESDAPGEDDELTVVARVAAEDEELAAAVEERLSELRERVDEQAAALDERTDQLQRTQADFQNYKKRAKKRQDQLEERATEDLVTRLLDVRDDLTRALDAEGDADDLREGVEMTLREFDRVLADENVAEITPDEGDEVDPSRHEVLMRVESDQPEGTVASVFQAGYEMAGKVVRPAQVTVSEGGSEGEPDAE